MSSRQALGLGKRGSLVNLCQKVGEKVEPKLIKVAVMFGSGATVTCVVNQYKKGKQFDIENVVAAIKDDEIYPKIYRLVNGNVDARKALGYRIDPRNWTNWEYVKMKCQTLYEKMFAGSNSEINFCTPLLRKFQLPCQGSRQNGVLQVWASRHKIDEGWEMERMELSFSPRMELMPNKGLNINANAIGNDAIGEEVSEELDCSPVDIPHVHDFQSELLISESVPDQSIVIWIDSGVSPRAQLLDPTIELASLPNMDDPWKIQLDDFEEPAVDYINEQ